jgi:hypothetical protein
MGCLASCKYKRGGGGRGVSGCQLTRDGVCALPTSTSTLNSASPAVYAVMPLDADKDKLQQL